AALVKLSVVHLGLTNSPVVDGELCKGLPEMSDLRYLTLQGATVTDALLPDVARCPRLLSLQVGLSDVSGPGLEALRGMSTLQRLQVTTTTKKVTEAGVKKLAAALPKCRIEWDGGVIEPKKP